MDDSEVESSWTECLQDHEFQFPENISEKRLRKILSNRKIMSSEGEVKARETLVDLFKKYIQPLPQRKSRSGQLQSSCSQLDPSCDRRKEKVKSHKSKSSVCSGLSTMQCESSKGDGISPEKIPEEHGSTKKTIPSKPVKLKRRHSEQADFKCSAAKLPRDCDHEEKDLNDDDSSQEKKHMVSRSMSPREDSNLEERQGHLQGSTTEEKEDNVAKSKGSNVRNSNCNAQQVKHSRKSPLEHHQDSRKRQHSYNEEIISDISKNESIRTIKEKKQREREEHHEKQKNTLRSDEQSSRVHRDGKLHHNIDKKETFSRITWP